MIFDALLSFIQRLMFRGYSIILLFSLINLTNCGSNATSTDSSTNTSGEIVPNTKSAPNSSPLAPSSSLDLGANQATTIVHYYLAGRTEPDIAARRHLQYISSSTTSLTITTTPIGGSPTTFGPTACTTITCTINFSAIPGPTALTFVLTDGTGQTLSSFSKMEIIQPSTVNTLNFTANPVVSKVVLQLGSSTVTAGTPTAVPLIINAYDIDENIITGNNNFLDTNGNPLALLLNTTNTQSGGTGSINIQGPLRITGPNQSAVYAKYDGRWLKQATISVTSSSNILSNFTNVVLTTIPTLTNSYTIPTSNSGTQSLTLGPDMNLWFAENSANKIGRMKLNGSFTEWATPSANSTPFGMNVGADGRMWVSEFALNKYAAITMSGVITEYTLPGYFPQWTVLGPDGHNWVTEHGIGVEEIVYSTTNGITTIFPLPNASGPQGISVGPDGNLWFADTGTNQIARFTLVGGLTEFNIPTANSIPTEITTGPDGNLWFTENGVSKIGRITTSGSVTEFTIPTSNSQPYGIVQGPDGNLWFTEANSKKIGFITTSGSITEYTLPPSGAKFMDIVVGPDNNIWFTGYSSNTIYQFIF